MTTGGTIINISRYFKIWFEFCITQYSWCINPMRTVHASSTI